MEEQKVHSMNPRNVFTDPRLPRGAMQLFAVICGFDRGRGCWAGRNTLARMVNASVSSVEHWISYLQRRGYLTVQRRKDLPAMLRVDPDSRRLSGLGGGFPRMEWERVEGRLLEAAPGAGLEDAAGGLDPEPVPEGLPDSVTEALLENVTEASKSSTAFNKQQVTTDSYQEDLYSVRSDETPVDAVVVSEETKINFSVFPYQAPEPEPDSFTVADAVLSVVSEETKTDFSVFSHQASEPEPDSFPAADSVPPVVTGEIATGFPLFPPGVRRGLPRRVVSRGQRRRVNQGPVAIAEVLPSVFSRMAPRSQPEHVPVSDFAPSVSLQQAPRPGSGLAASTNPLQAVTNVLTGVGVDAPTARDLARSFPASKCRAMAAYAKDRGVRNPGGFIRQGLREGWAIPERYHRSETPEKRAERGLEAPISPPVTPESPVPGWGRSGPVAGREASPLPQTSNPFSRPEPEGLKVRNRYAGVWRKAIAQMRDTRNLNAWIAPLYVSGLVERCYIGLMDAGTVTLIAPNGYVSEGIRVHLPQVLEGIKSAGMAVDRIAVKQGDVGQ